MARYLVIEFRNNEDADKLAEKVLESSRMGKPMRVVGLFAKPGKPCMCPDWQRVNYGDKNQPVGIARGERFGWWVCERCSRPRRAGHTLVNLIKPSETFAEGDIIDPQYEVTVSSLGVGGISRANIIRPKALTKLKKKKGDN